MAGYKHSDPVHLRFGQTGDGSLLAKTRRNYARGGTVDNDPFQPDMSDDDAIRAAYGVGDDLLAQAGLPGIEGNPDWAVVTKRRRF
jgi:hypothetical protein